MLELAKKIELSPEVISELENLIADKGEKIKYLAKKAEQRAFIAWGAKILWLCLLLY